MHFQGTFDCHDNKLVILKLADDTLRIREAHPEVDLRELKVSYWKDQVTAEDLDKYKQEYYIKGHAANINAVAQARRSMDGECT